MSHKTQLAICLALLTAAATGCATHTRPNRGVDGESFGAWRDSLAREAPFSGRPLAELTGVLGSQVVSRSAVYWGGTGRRRVFILMPGKIEIAVDVDRADLIEGEPCVMPAFSEYPDARDSA